MGTDIHTHIFHRTADGSYEELITYVFMNGEFKPITWQAPYNDRNYFLFDVLCGYGCGVADIDEPLVQRMRGKFPFAPQSAELDEEDNYCWGFHYFDWTELVALSNGVGCPIESDEAAKFRIVKEWIHKMRFVLDCYGIYYPDPGEIIIQICFDN